MDVKLVGRAIREGWNVDKEAIKQALMQCLTDPDLAIDAAKVLLAADAIDCKREELDAKREAKENEQRLRLLELAQSVPIAELTKLASENGIASRPD
jgi:chaperonin GroEL (HSP60 family)